MSLLIPFLRQALYGGLALTLLAPFVYTNSTTFPFVFGKVVALRILVEIVFAIWTALILLDPASRPRRSAVLTALGFWTLALIASTVFGVDPHRSFWGNHERMSGLFTIFHTLALVPVAATVLRTDRHWMRFWMWGLITANFMAALGLVQFFSENNFLLTRGGGRIWATLGNYIYLGQYALFFSLLAFGLAALAPTPRLRWFAAGTGALQVIILALTETRGALIGFAVALAFLFGWFSFRSDALPSRSRRWVRLTGAVVIVAGLLFSFFGHDASFARYIPGLRRFTYEGFSTTAGGTSTRLIAWSIALEAWKHRPIFGWGVENFNYAFNRFYHPESLRYSYYETWFDRAHNAHLDVLATNGLAGVAAAIFLYVVVLRTLFRSAHADRRSATRAGFALAIFIAYLVQLTFVFDSPNSYLLTALFLAWVVRIGWGDSPPLAVLPEGKPLPLLPAFGAAIAAVGALILIFATNVQPVRANRRGLQASALVHFRNDLSGALAKHREALTIYTPHHRDLRLDFARDVSELLGNGNTVSDEALPAWEQAVAGLEENIRRNPQDAYEHLLLATLYTQGTNRDPSALDKAAAILERAIPLSPKRQQLFFTLGKTKLLQQKSEEAISVLAQAVTFDDGVYDAHWYYGLALSEAGRRPEAYAEIQRAITLGYPWRTPVEILFAAGLAQELKDYATAYSLLNSASSTYGSIPEFQARLAEAAAGAGDRAAARAAAEKAVAGDPALRDRLRTILSGS